jgi:hypothetical protein
MDNTKGYTNSGAGMTAPGMHLEFGESGNFQRKAAALTGLSELVKVRLKDWSQAGTVICGQVREFRAVLGANAYAVLYVRRGQRIGLLDAFELPQQEPQLEAYRAVVKDLFCGGGR